MYSLEHIIFLVCTYYDITIDELLSASRKARLVDTRHIIMHILKEDYRASDKQISKLLNRSRSSVYHGILKIHNLKAYDKELLLDLINIRTFIQYPETIIRKRKKINKRKFSKPRKRIYQYCSCMHELGVFDTVKKAAKGTRISVSTINRSLAEYRRMGGGFLWIKK